MIDALALGITSLINQPNGNFYEAELTIPSGWSEITTEMSWNSVALKSKDDQELPEIGYQNDDGELTDWHLAEGTHAATDLIHTGDERQVLRVYSPETVNVIAHFFNTHQAGETFTARFDPFDDDSRDDPLTGLAPKLNIEPPKYISRSEWGADESLRVWKSRNPFKRFIKKWFQAEAEQVPADYRPKLITNKNKAGEPLYWPISESPKVAKFVIHHTGEYVKHTRRPSEIMRSIYNYHTITRGWGDIGYNYVIDKQGNIYEGRAGGPRCRSRPDGR
jgi:hypothetical protein